MDEHVHGGATGGEGVRMKTEQKRAIIRGFSYNNMANSLLLIILIGNTLDGLLTYYGVMFRGHEEGNELIRFLLNSNSIIYILIKLILPIFLVYIAIRETNAMSPIKTTSDKISVWLGLVVLYSGALIQWIIVYSWIYVLQGGGT